MNAKTLLPLLLLFIIGIFILTPVTQNGVGWSVGIEYEDGSTKETSPDFTPFGGGKLPINLPIKLPFFPMAVYKYGESKPIKSLFGKLYLAIEYEHGEPYKWSFSGEVKAIARVRYDPSEPFVEKVLVTEEITVSTAEASIGSDLSTPPKSGEKILIYKIEIDATALESEIKNEFNLKNGDFYIYFILVNFRVSITTEDGETVSKEISHSISSNTIHLEIKDFNINRITIEWGSPTPSYVIIGKEVDVYG